VTKPLPKPNDAEPRHTSMPAAWRIGLPFPIGPRVEDPVRISEFSERLARLSWSKESDHASLRVVFDCVAQLTLAEIRYYYCRRAIARRWSQILRFIAWTSGTAALLVPLVSPIWPSAPKTFLSWGYLAAGFAGALLVAESVLVGSAAHHRYVKTQLDLEKRFSIFALEWQALMITFQASEDANRAEPLVHRAVKYCGQLHESLGVETTEWGVEREQALAELRRHSADKKSREGGS
jgi:hypothetical protein